MYPYPPTFPTEEAKVLVSAMSGGTSGPAAAETMHAAWVMGGFGMAQLAPLPPSIKKSAGKPVTVGDVKAKLEEAIKASETKKGLFDLPSLNIPWCELYCLMLRTIQEGVQILVDANCPCIC